MVYVARSCVVIFIAPWIKAGRNEGTRTNSTAHELICPNERNSASPSEILEGGGTFSA
jgi:hypothetical protein